MADSEIHIELLLSRRVTDLNGETVGRIEEFHTKQEGDENVIEEYLLGPYALLERLSALAGGFRLFRWFGIGKTRRYKVRWDQMDLSDPKRPRVLCAKDDLEKL
ncbi:MAG TPA: hypothetical protein VNN73_11030 [Blastocatellia bacterium]|nr:hypothetical protein [Blastocatellia bacterium]